MLNESSEIQEIRDAGIACLNAVTEAFDHIMFVGFFSPRTDFSNFTDEDQRIFREDLATLAAALERIVRTGQPAANAFADVSLGVFPLDEHKSTYCLSALHVIPQTTRACIQIVKQCAGGEVPYGGPKVWGDRYERRKGELSSHELNQIEFFRSNIPYWQACFLKECISASLRTRPLSDKEWNRGTTQRPKLRGNRKRVFEAIEAAGHRMTAEEIIKALKPIQMKLGTIKPILAEFMRAGFLTNDRFATPPGYGLPEWT